MSVTAGCDLERLQHPLHRATGKQGEFLADYLPTKFGSCLTSKLNKKNAAGESYWERGETPGEPFILAIADFTSRAV